MGPRRLARGGAPAILSAMILRALAAVALLAGAGLAAAPEEAERIETEEGAFYLAHPGGLKATREAVAKINAARTEHFGRSKVSQKKVEEALDQAEEGWESTVFRLDVKTGFLFGALQFCEGKFDKIRCRQKKDYREDGPLVYLFKPFRLNAEGRTVRAVATPELTRHGEPRLRIEEIDKDGHIYQSTSVTALTASQIRSESP